MAYGTLGRPELGLRRGSSEEGLSQDTFGR